MPVSRSLCRGVPECPAPSRSWSEFAVNRFRFLAFLDGFVGTGNQIAEFWHEELRGTQEIENAELYFPVLLGFRQGIQYVQTQTPFKVICLELLDERDRAFSPESTTFGSSEKRRRVEGICRQYGEILCPKFPLGYDDSQALLAFEYQTPNNSLPILWSSAEGCTPIIERKS